MKKLIALLAMLVIGSGSVFAGFWDWSTPYQGPDKDVITLVITGNYKTSRTMAELIQYETRQPFILLPYSGAKGIFFCPTGGADAVAMEIEPDKFAQFVGFLNPKRIIILGDERYVDPEYRRLLQHIGFAPVTFSGDWNNVARDVAAFMRLQYLEKNFEYVQKHIGTYVPGQGKSIAVPATVITVTEK